VVGGVGRRQCRSVCDYPRRQRVLSGGGVNVQTSVCKRGRLRRRSIAMLHIPQKSSLLRVRTTYEHERERHTRNRLRAPKATASVPRTHLTRRETLPLRQAFHRVLVALYCCRSAGSGRAWSRVSPQGSSRCANKSERSETKSQCVALASVCRSSPKGQDAGAGAFREKWWDLRKGCAEGEKRTRVDRTHGLTVTRDDT